MFNVGKIIEASPVIHYKILGLRMTKKHRQIHFSKSQFIF